MLEKGVKRHLSSRRRKQYRRPSYPQDPTRLESQHEVSDQKSQMEIYLPQENIMCIGSTLAGPTINVCLFIM